MKALVLLSVLLTGCATCREHPVVCTVVPVFVAGAVIASGGNHQPTQPNPQVRGWYTK